MSLRTFQPVSGNDQWVLNEYGQIVGARASGKNAQPREFVTAVSTPSSPQDSDGYRVSDANRLSGASAALVASSAMLKRKGILDSRMVPTIRPGSGNVTSVDGALSFPGFPTGWVVPAGVVCKVYLPASVLGTAGLYDCTITSANDANPATAQLVGNPATTIAAFTSSSAQTILYTTTCPGGLLGTTGQIDIVVEESHSGPTPTATRKTDFLLHLYELGGTSNNTTAISSRKSVGRIKNRGSAAKQVGLFPSSANFYADSSANAARTYAEVDTTIDRTINVALTASGAETVVYDSIIVEVTPG